MSEPRVAKTVFDHLDRPPTFEEVKEHIITFLEKQNAFGMSLTGGGCSYLTDEGNKCAVGCLLDDVEAAREWDDQNESAIANIIAAGRCDGCLKVIPPKWMREMGAQLVPIQVVHDAHSALMKDEGITTEEAIKRAVEQIRNLKPAQ